MLRIESVASYHLAYGESDHVEQTNGLPFDDESYSRMKHGVISDSRFFADQLTTTLREEAPEIVYGDLAPAVVVAYESLPHAATVVAKFCLESMNKIRTQHSLEPGCLIRIHTTDYMEPYSHQSLAEREQILQTQSGVVEGDLGNKRPVIIDDIRVTGSQEKWFYNKLAPHAREPVYAAYIANFSACGQHPELEGSLDKAHIATLYDLLPYIEGGEVIVTHKLVRDLLLLPLDELSYFLSCLPSSTMTAVQYGIRGMSCNTLLPYQLNQAAILEKDVIRIPSET